MAIAVLAVRRVSRVLAPLAAVMSRVGAIFFASSYCVADRPPRTMRSGPSPAISSKFSSCWVPTSVYFLSLNLLSDSGMTRWETPTGSWPR